MKIRLYWHIYLTNRWRRIVSEQLVLMMASGLYDACEDIYLSINCEEDCMEFREFVRLTKSFDKLHMLSLWTKPEKYEFPAMEKIFDYCKLHPEPHIVYYIHSKGVSYKDDKHSNWRDILNEGVITKWREHVKAIEDGAQVSGQNYIAQTENNAAYFSGNFWAADSRYIATLADPRTLDQSNRYEAERWICSGNPKVNALPFIEPNP